jgi:hypothetical protein
MGEGKGQGRRSDTLSSIPSCHQIDRITRWELGIIHLTGDPFDFEIVTEPALDLSSFKRFSKERYQPLPPTSGILPTIQQEATPRMRQRQHVFHVQIAILRSQIILSHFIASRSKLARSLTTSRPRSRRISPSLAKVRSMRPTTSRTVFLRPAFGRLGVINDFAELSRGVG